MDDGIIISLDDDMILRFIAELRECKFDLGIEADYAGYLGVDLFKLPDGWFDRKHHRRFRSERLGIFQAYASSRSPWPI